MCQLIVENKVAFAEQKAQCGNVGRMAADIDNAVFCSQEVGYGFFQDPVRGTLAADQAAGSGRGAENFSSLCYFPGDFRMCIDIQVIVGGEVDIVFALDMYGRFCGPVGIQEKGAFHAHLLAKSDKSVKGQLGADL